VFGLKVDAKQKLKRLHQTIMDAVEPPAPTKTKRAAKKAAGDKTAKSKDKPKQNPKPKKAKAVATPPASTP